MQHKNPVQGNLPLLPEKVLGKSLPYSPEAERAVLGALLLNDQRLDEIIGILNADDFYVPAHRHIFKAMVHCASKQQRLDLVTLQDHLSKQNVLEASGGVSFLIALQEDIPALGLLEQHARLVKEKSVLRELINSATTIISNCYAQDDKGIEAVVDEAEKTIFNIAAKRTNDNFVQLNIWLKRTFQALSDIKLQARGVTGIPTGFERLNEMTSGLQKSDLVVLAARPSMGKTALALGFAHYASCLGYSVGFFSLEMSAEQLTMRLLSSESGVHHHNIRNGSISSEEWVEITHAAARMAERKLFIDDGASQTITDVRAKARRLKQEQGLNLLVIDYLQLIQSSKHFENRHQEVSDISRSLKALAKELGIPIIALSQLSRAVDARIDKRPLLSDLRESGAIEQDADLIMFLYRDSVYNQETERPELSELIIGKQRNGPTGTVYLNYQREIMLFEEAEQPV